MGPPGVDSKGIRTLKKYQTDRPPLIQRFLQAASRILILYLSVMISGCSFRPAELSPEKARVLQTRELNGSPDEVAKAVVVVLQDLHYTLGNVDMNMGLITAERLSERLLAPISRETVSDNEVNKGIRTFFIVAAVIAVVGFLFAWMADGDEDEDNDQEEDTGWRFSHRSGRHSHGHDIYYETDEQGPDSYRYSMTVMLEEITAHKTRVRVTVQGQHLEGSRVLESGPVQTEEFYSDFYSRLQAALNR